MVSCETCTGCDDGENGCGKRPPAAALPTDRPLVVWDGDCTFCRRWIKRYSALAGNRIDFAPLQDAAQHFSHIPKSQFERAIHLITPDGQYTSGAEAMCELQARIGVRRWPLWVYRRVRPLGSLAEVAYNWIANHRGGLNRVSTLLVGRVETPSTWLLTRRIFLRLMGLIYLAAFLSFGHQALGLIGSEGLRPSGVFMQAVSEHGSWWQAPTLQWLGGDSMLTATWIIGAVAACMLTLGIVPLCSAILCWGTYLSLVTVGSVFMQYQWDALLLETGVLAMLWCPWTWRLNSVRATRPSRLIHWLLVILLARLLFFAALVKIQSGDPTWADGTAISYHFWTQPLPWWPAWIAASLPNWILWIGGMLMFAVEFGAPILLFLPRVLRTTGAIAIVVLMLGISATGNYGIFNWLTIVLCIAMLDDSVLLMLWPKYLRPTIAVGLREAAFWPLRCARWGAGAMLLSLIVILCLYQTIGAPLWKPLSSWHRTLSPWHLVSRYGLFATMTKTRPEIIVEAQSQDGTWAPYVFKWKAGPLNQVGGFSQPDMPRLDWQLWFDALSYEHALRSGILRPGDTMFRLTGQEVLPQLLSRLAVNDPAVMALLESSPLKSDQSPAALRWHLDHYRFTTTEERDASGNWWSATRIFSSPELRYQPSPEANPQRVQPFGERE
jgi:predicted DCC family thiol-disulfide oxidoreductase YuxK